MKKPVALLIVFTFPFMVVCLVIHIILELLDDFATKPSSVIFMGIGNGFYDSNVLAVATFGSINSSNYNSTNCLCFRVFQNVPEEKRKLRNKLEKTALRKHYNQCSSMHGFFLESHQDFKSKKHIQISCTSEVRIIFVFLASSITWASFRIFSRSSKATLMMLKTRI